MHPIWRTLPVDLVIQHIMPFIYQPQSKRMLRDIRSFYEDFSLIDESYVHDYNHYMLLTDILGFFTLLEHSHYVETGVEKILRRHMKYADCDISVINKAMYSMYYKNLEKEDSLVQKVRFLWGLMLPVERARFINKFLLEY